MHVGCLGTPQYPLLPKPPVDAPTPSAYHPPTTQVVITMCCRLTDLQQLLYMHFAASSATRNLIKENKQVKDARVLSFITALKKLCNHPKLIYDAVHSKAQKVPDGFQVGTRWGVRMG